MSRRNLIIGIGIALLGICLTGWWLGGEAGGSERGSVQRKSPAHKPSSAPPIAPAASGGSNDRSVKRGSEIPTVASWVKEKSVAELLSSYELDGNLSTLAEAQRLFPDDKRVIQASCLVATSPSDPWLKKLEEIQPDNALPNIIRAALYADVGNPNGFRTEMEAVMSKKVLNIGARERQAAVLDRLLAQPGLISSKYIVSQLDETFMRQIDKIRLGFSKNPKLFGDEWSSASTAVFLAEKLRGMSDYNFTLGIGANYIEFEMLKNVGGSDAYGDTGMTVAQRQEELKKLLIDSQNRTNVFRKYVLADNADPARRLQFFTRMRADGERAAFKWLWQDTKDLRSSK